jgi:tetratricopeptide (TPR) repeat protein
MERLETDEPPCAAMETAPEGSRSGEAIGPESSPPPPGDESSPAVEREERLFAVLAAYLQAVESGQTPSRRELLENHPDIADDLEAFLQQDEALQRLSGHPSLAAAPSSSVLGQSIEAPTRGEPLPLRRELSPAPPEGDVVDFGDYELLEVIARGGMGIVFRARHKELGRLVALKMILRGDLASEEERRRFRLEASAIARMDHPHIVPIYEVGEHQGHCFYAMKLIEGGGLDRRLDVFHGDPRSAVRLMMDVARAVHHAHQRGILHRDLKPSNILIDGEGRPHVADFGLAKWMESDGADATRTGLVLGTPSYMAPEQASGQRDAVTISTDVYGLGAVLYALLTGRPPFRGESILDTIEQVRVREPDPPSRPDCRIDRDLQTICLTCLRKEPGRRYRSAAALVDDLERWLARQPIAARPISPAERIWRWVRREPLSAGLAAMVVVLMILGVAGLVVSNLLIARERDDARVQKRIAEEQSRQADAQHRRADERSRQARRAVDEMYTQVAERWLYDQPRLSEVQREFLEKALRFYEDLAREDADDPAVQVDRAKALGRVAWIRLRLGQPQQLQAALYQPAEILRALTERSPDRLDYLEGLGEACALLSAQLSEQKRWEEASRAREQAVEAYQKLVRRMPGEARYRSALAMNQAQLGVQYQASGRVEEAERLGFASVATLDAMRRDFPGRSDARDRSARMRVLEDLGSILVESRRFGEAESALREALALGEQLPDGTIARQDLLHRMGHTNLYLGQVLIYAGRDGEAEAIFLRARDLFERLVRDYPDLPPYQVDLVDAHLGLATVFAETGRRDEALKMTRRLVEQGERLATDHPDLVSCQRVLVSSLLRLGRTLTVEGPPAEVEHTYQHAVDVGERLAAIDSFGIYSRFHLACGQLELGEFLQALGRRDAAQTMIDRAIKLLDDLVGRCAAVGVFRQRLGQAHAARVEILIAAGDREGARRAFRSAASLFGEVAARADGEPEFICQFARFLSCSHLTELRDPARAVNLARDAVRRFPQHGRLWSVLGLSCYRAGDCRGAIDAAEQSMRLENGDDALNRLIFAVAYHQAGNEQASRRWYRSVIHRIDSLPNWPADMATLREEAAALLGPAAARPKGTPAAHEVENGP